MVVNFVALGLFIAAPEAANDVLHSGASPSVQIRADGPALTLEQATALSPAALGEALLAAPHLPVVEAFIGPERLEPPTPPGLPVVTRVKLYLQPTRSRWPGFCSRVIATAHLQPVDRLPNGTLPPARAADASAQIGYQWAGEKRRASHCAAPATNYFIPRPGEEQQAIAAVRALVLASEAAKSGQRLDFPVSVEDKKGPQALAFSREHPELPASRVKIVTDGRKALAALPVDAVHFAGPAASAFPNILEGSDLPSGKNGDLQAMTIFLGGDWVAGMVLNRDRIVRLRLLREIPAPF